MLSHSPPAATTPTVGSPGRARGPTR
jgi:hypothetical protein